MQRQCPVTYSPSAAIHTQHRLGLFIMRQCLKIIKTIWQNHIIWNTFHMIFPWETADEYLHQGKGGKIQTIVRFSVQTLIILNLVSWNGLHRSNIFKMIVCWEYTVSERLLHLCEKSLCIWFLWISCCPHQEIHFKITFHYTHIVKLIPTYAAYNNVHLFEVDFLKHYLVQYSLMIQYGPIFSTHQHEHNTSMLDWTIKTPTLDKTSWWSLS